MDKLIRKRKTQAKTVESICAELEAELNKDVKDKAVIETFGDRLSKLEDKIESINDELIEKMIDSKKTEDECDDEQKIAEKIINQIGLAKISVKNALATPRQANAPANNNFKLPKIEMVKYGGEVHEWLGWWAQYQKIHEDGKIDTASKFHYLIQSLVPGSSAANAIKNYPVTADNYLNAIKSLQTQFGNPKVLWKYYMREFIKLVQNPKKLDTYTVFNVFQSQLRAIESLGNISRDDFLCPLLESMIGEEVMVAWMRSPNYGKDGSKENPPVSELQFLLNFLEEEGQREKIKMMGQPNQNKEKRDHRDRRGNNKNDIPTVAELHINKASNSCIFCSKSHESDKCGFAQKWTLEERNKKVQETRACFKCLKVGHTSSKCRSFVKCHYCDGRHPTILCRQKYGDKTSGDKQNKKEEAPTVPVGVSQSNGVIFQTLSVRLIGRNGITHTARVFLDIGSSKSFIKTSTAKLLGLKSVGAEFFRKTWINNMAAPPQEHPLYDVTMESIAEKKNLRKMTLTGLDAITKIPSIPNGPWINELRKRKIWLTDVNQPSSPEIEILIGADYYNDLIIPKQEIRLNGGIVARETIFGWVVMGRIPDNRNEDTIASVLCANLNDISNLWDLELLGIRDPIEVQTEAQKEEEAIKAFENKITRSPDGRYSVGLPWADGKEELPSNRRVAEKRLLAETRRMGERITLYNDVFKSWKEEGLIEEVHDKEENCHYLPHHPVFKESKTTPVRPVFDASCKVNGYPSLNDCLYKGPNLIELIPKVLMRFRSDKIGVVSDIRKAFQMISVNEEDRDYLRFLWWDAEFKKIVVLRHCRVVFGVSSSPFLLAATIKTQVKQLPEEKKEFAQKFFQSLYVDNSVTAVASIEEYREFRDKAVEVMKDAGMELRLWETSEDYNEESPISPLLGYNWNKKDDSISCVDITVDPDLDGKLTKRAVLSILHKVYDPIGFTCPAMLQVKKIVQETWRLGLDWDKELPEDLKKAFIKWMEEIKYLAKIRIPRQAVFPFCANQLHMFCDASGYAYTAIVFIRTETEDGVDVQLIDAKNRVAPIKKPSPTIPRLELLGCYIGARQLKNIRETLQLENCREFCWTDSSTALAWILRRQNWGNYVGNRVKGILKDTDVNTWNHIPGVDNPADLPSRGCGPRELFTSNWWEGPSWLKLNMDEWPCSTPVYNEKEISLELKKTEVKPVQVNVLKVIDYTKPTFSSYSKNLRVYGWMLRFAQNSRKLKEERCFNKYLTLPELKEARTHLDRFIQQEAKIQKKKKIGNIQIKLVDTLYRVITRLPDPESNSHFRSPIFLPKDHPLVEMMVREIHETYCHAGVQFVMGKIRERYWILHGRRTIRGILRKCVKCRRYNAKRMEAKAAALPEKRITVGPPFQTTGVDLAGPLFLKNGTKTWIVLYTCAVYRCVHLDLVTSLSTETFLKSLERFIHSEGRPDNIFSDNGTNFVGAENLLKKVNWKELEEKFCAKKIHWTFNPPTAAWWGGFWERLIRSTKDLLRKTLGTAILTYDELRTCLAAASHTINGRPLTTVTEDINDLAPLTPDMFRRGLVMGGFPESKKLEGGSELQLRYKIMNSVKEQLNVRFRKEYLAQLAFCAKNKKSPSPELKINDLVLIGADNIKRLLWPLGRIIELIPGKDGVIRVAKLRTANGILTRPLQRLYPLEVSHESLPNVTPEVQKTVNEDKDDDTESESEEESVKGAKKNLHEESSQDSKGAKKNMPEEKKTVTRTGREIKKPSRYN